MSKTLHEPVSAFVTVNGVRLHYVEWGEAANPVIVMLHGASSNCHNWDFMCRSLADDYHILAIDQRGHGDSGRPASGYHPADYAADLAAFREAMGLERIFLIGHSMGGRVALLHTAQSGSPVAGLVLVDCGPSAPRAGLERITQAITSAPDSFADEQEAYAYIKMLRPRYSHETLQNRVSHALLRREDGRLAWKYDRDALLQSIHGSVGVDWWDCLAKVPCPTLVVRGAESDILPQEIARRMLEVLQASELVEIAEGSHAVPFEDTTVFESAVRRFLARLT